MASLPPTAASEKKHGPFPLFNLAVKVPAGVSYAVWLQSKDTEEVEKWCKTDLQALMGKQCEEFAFSVSTLEAESYDPTYGLKSDIRELKKTGTSFLPPDSYKAVVERATLLFKHDTFTAQYNVLDQLFHGWGIKK
jgi:hypothetical protein